MKVGEVCSHPVVSAPASATLAEVAALMRDYHVGAVVVTKATLDRPIPVGMVTDRDIVHAQLDHTADLSRLCAETIMTRDPLVLNVEDSLEVAIQRLRARGVRRAPVIDTTGGSCERTPSSTHALRARCMTRRKSPWRIFWSM